MYIRLSASQVVEVIPSYDENFPGVPIQQRYPPDYLENLILCDDALSPQIGMTLGANGQFYFPDSNCTTNENKEDMDNSPEPFTQEDYNLDFDFRIACLELGL